MHTLTPFGFRDEMNSHLGSAFSVEPILTQSAWFRPHNRAAKATAGVIADDFAGELSKAKASGDWPANS